jgi:UDP-2,3-diacylglucosamine hydrolase
MSALPHRALFVSDLHLGTRYSGAREDRESLFEQFLREQEGRISHLYLLGDVFEFWMEYRHYIPKHHFGVLAALHRLRRAGVEIHYVCGNHDFNLGRFFSDQLGIITHNGPFAMTLQGQNLLILHGDGMNPKDKAYRLVRKVLHSRWANFLWKLIHPDLGMRIALGVGKASRDQHGSEPRDLDQYEAEARRMLRAGGHDAVIHGHIHAGFINRLPEGLHINTGEWLKRLEYVEMEGGRFELKTYRQEV